MSYPFRAMALALVLAAGGASLGRAEDPVAANQKGVLVFKTGRVLEGAVTRLGDRYLVSLGGVDEITVPAATVEFVGSSVDEAYLFKRDQLAKNTAAARLELADWCLRSDLFGRAAEELLAAMQLEPEHPSIAGFEKRLRLAARQRPKPTDEAAPAAPPAPTRDELDQLIGRLPPGSVEQFTGLIQPLLINRCGATGCHGVQTPTGFRLMRPTASRTLPRVFTQRNLQSTLSMIDRAQPDASRLLMMPAAAHGRNERPIFGEHERAQFEQLANWVRQVADPTPQELPATIVSQASILRQATDGQPDDLPPAESAGREATAEAVPGASGAALPSELPRSERGYTPRDPFDPEIFNRRHARRAP